MARSIEQIYNSIPEQKEFEPQDVVTVHNLFGITLEDVLQDPVGTTKASESLYIILQDYRQRGMTISEVRKDIKDHWKKLLAEAKKERIRAKIELN